MSEHRKEFEVVVIGAGPAGISCAKTLQKNRISNCIIEKKQFPRNKTCGGLVSNKTTTLLKENFPNVSKRLDEVAAEKTADVSLKNGEESSADFAVKDAFYIVKRITFDNCLLEEYKSLEGIIFENETDYSIDFSTNTIVLTDGSKLKYNYLVFADGANSTAHNLFNIKRKGMGIGVEAFVPKRGKDFSKVVIDFGAVGNGYAWIFPAGDDVNIGLGSKYKKSDDYVGKLKKYLTTFGVSDEEMKDIKIKGAFLPYGKVVNQKKTPQNVLLIGDAAGFVDSIYGEGLYFAILSGKIAAESIKSDYPKKEYMKNTYSIRKQISQGSKVYKILFSGVLQRKLNRLIKRSSGFLRYYCETQVCNYNRYHMQLLKIIRDYKKSKRDS